MQLDAQGWLDLTHSAGERIRHAPSPNADERPSDAGAVSLIVVHAISLPPEQFGGDAIERFFLNQLDPRAHPYFQTIATVRVSAHFLIRRDGEIIQFVATDRRAWHAGASHWRGRDRCNDFSVGIELEGSDLHAFDEEQYERLNELIATLCRRHPVCAVVGHSDIAPRRKTDPGPCFDWRRIAPLDDKR